jgi:RNA polymerase sigma-70 factor (ECF subfamily)
VTPKPELEDAEVMNAVRAGEISSLGILFERYHASIYRYCVRLTGNPATSEDLVQEVFTRLLKYAHTFREGTNFKAWIYRISRNVCHDHYRRRGREIELEEPDAQPADVAPVHERLERAEDLTRLSRALGRLPEDRRELLILSRFEHRKYSEIAQLLDCSVGAVKVRVHRAMRQLRDIYTDLASEAAQ